MTVLESTLSVENRYRQLFRQRLVILAVIFIAIIASLLLDFTLGVLIHLKYEKNREDIGLFGIWRD